MWGEILGAITGPIADYFTQRQKRKAMEFEMEMDLKKARATAAAERIMAREQADIKWEIESIRNSGWKDEFLTVMTTIMVVLLFIPQTQEFMSDGIFMLNSMPLWFQTIVLMVYASAFGIRVFDNFRKLLSHGK